MTWRDTLDRILCAVGLANRHAAGLSAVFGALFIIYGVQLTYLPVWLDARGLSAKEIALATSAPTFLRIVITPAIAMLADKAEAHRRFVIALAWAALALLAVLARLERGGAIIVLIVLVMIAVQSVMPLLDTITMRVVRREGIDYGRVRLWGSSTFILASYAAGFAVATAGAGSVIWLLIGGAMLTAASAVALPASTGTPGEAPSQSPEMAAPARPTFAGMLRFVARPRFFLFMIAASATQASHATFYVFGVLHLREQGISAAAIGTLWAISVLAEIALFWMAGSLRLLSPLVLLLAGAAAGVLRWTAMAFDPPLAVLVALQLLHAGTFAATHLGAMHWISANVPESGAGTAQALLSSVANGVAMGGAMLLSGALYASVGGLSYLAMAALCFVGGVSAIMLAWQDRARRGAARSAG